MLYANAILEPKWLRWFSKIIIKNKKLIYQFFIFLLLNKRSSKFYPKLKKIKINKKYIAKLYFLFIFIFFNFGGLVK